MAESSNFLEVDSKILENKFLLNDHSPNSDRCFEKFLRSPEKYSKDFTPWKQATPISGFCIKTRNDVNEKVFINLCQLEDIPEPKNLTEAELIELWQSDEVSDYRIPLSIQDPHNELDKSGSPVVVYDVAVNTKFFQKLKESQIFRSFVLQVVFEGLENKYDLILNKEDFVILKNRKCVGELKPHRIRTEKSCMQPKRLIEELPKSNNYIANEETLVKGKKIEVPEFRLFENSLTGVLIGEFCLPKLVELEDLVLNVGEDRLILESKRVHYFLDLFLPIKIDLQKTAARYCKKKKMLTVMSVPSSINKSITIFN